jgi:PPOX class probable FMN-dependent enzyme
MYEPTDIVTSEQQLRDLFPTSFASQTGKVIDHIDGLCRKWIERSPFVAVATVGAAGHVDVAPKGDPPGFVQVLDDKTLAIPDRPGNFRYDTFINIMETGRIGLCFAIPRRNEVVRVNGSARVIRDADLLVGMAVNDRVPPLAILVRVEEAFYHCGKAMIRSRMWQPDQWGDIDGIPTYAEALVTHARLERSVEDMAAGLVSDAKERLY